VARLSWWDRALADERSGQIFDAKEGRAVDGGGLENRCTWRGTSVEGVQATTEFALIDSSNVSKLGSGAKHRVRNVSRKGSHFS
jgi:hypothetical protein